jgi:hypothetical protein
MLYSVTTEYRIFKDADDIFYTSSMEIAIRLDDHRDMMREADGGGSVSTGLYFTPGLARSYQSD